MVCRFYEVGVIDIKYFEVLREPGFLLIIESFIFGNLPLLFFGEFSELLAPLLPGGPFLYLGLLFLNLFFGGTFGLCENFFIGVLLIPAGDFLAGFLCDLLDLGV